MLCPITVNSYAVELAVHNSRLWVLDLLCVTSEQRAEHPFAGRNTQHLTYLFGYLFFRWNLQFRHFRLSCCPRIGPSFPELKGNLKSNNLGFLLTNFKFEMNCLFFT